MSIAVIAALKELDQAVTVEDVNKPAAANFGVGTQLRHDASYP